MVTPGNQDTPLELCALQCGAFTSIFSIYLQNKKALKSGRELQHMLICAWVRRKSSLHRDGLCSNRKKTLHQCASINDKLLHTILMMCKIYYVSVKHLVL